ncbi:hypothetical protein R1sor_002818 [Riccia sorocarpa]|uniref:INTS8 TPR repeats domain-containing protein n=1 Tax=Riccia sorocarpa TaxID=122646 RepID=A0ABD3H1Z3_9MARC
MDRERERERAGARSDAASMWIDFLLLPAKLEEHLAAGPAAVPSPPDLITMFLEQAFLNQRAVNGGSSGNIAGKDQETQGSVKGASKTASVLCERAARVAVVAQLTLTEIESSLASQQHQFVLLKTLIRHDEGRSLLHECNLHRWLLHKALQYHPVGSAAPNVPFPTSRLGFSTAGDDLGEVFHNIFTGNGDTPPFSGESRLEEERASVQFLEQVLKDEGTSELTVEEQDGLAPTQTSGQSPRSNSQEVSGNKEAPKEQGLSLAYKCQVMFDVAEVHFMRGRIRQAYEYFIRCKESLDTRERVSRKEDGDKATEQVLPVPQDRLDGFIVACRMVLWACSGTEGLPHINTGHILQEVGSSFGSSSPSQQAIIQCERSRWISRRDRSAEGVVRSGSGNSREIPLKRGISESTRDDGTYANNEDNNTDDGASYRQNKRSRDSKYSGENGHVGPQVPDVENGQRLYTEGHTNRKLGSTESPEVSDSVTALKERVVEGVDSLQLRSSGVNETKREQTRLSKDQSGMDESHSNYLKQVPPSKTNQGTPYADQAPQIRLLVDLLKRETGQDTFDESYSLTDAAAIEKRPDPLIRSLIMDILKGHLSWAYCLSVEKDPWLSELDRSKVAACNLVRSVLEGTSVRIFLRVSEQFEGSEVAVEFLMQLLLAIKITEEGDMFSGEGSYAFESGQPEREIEMGLSKQVLVAPVTGETKSVVQRVHDLAMYVCCVIDKPWCWDSAVRHRMTETSDISKFSNFCPSSSFGSFESSATFDYAVSALNSSLRSDSENMEEIGFTAKSDILISLLQLETLTQIEAFVQGFLNTEGKAATSEEISGETEQSEHKVMSVAPVRVIQSEVERSGSSGTKRAVWSSLGADMAFVLKNRAFTALNVSKDTYVAKRFYELALGLVPENLDCIMMLWLLERTLNSEGRSEERVVHHWSQSLPAKSERGGLPSFVLVEFAILFLIEKEMWRFLSEFCNWVLSLLKDLTLQASGPDSKSESGSATGGSATSGTRGEGSSRIAPLPAPFKHRRLIQTLKTATILSDLLPLCVSLQTEASRNHFNEDVARLGSTLSQLFEDFMCVLVGIESGGQGSEDAPDWRSSQSGVNHSPLYTGGAGVPLIPKISNPRALMALASLTAGWLQRCHAAGLSTWSLAVERYGVLAGATAGAALPPPPGALPYSSSVLRPVPPRAPPEFGRDLFGVLLEAIVSIPGVVEGDREKGHRWLQGLADLAFEDEEYVKALRLYLQAGAIRSAHYCERSTSMARDVFTRWVMQRMVAACRAIGASIQAAVLCQCAPAPDHELAFRILQENTLIVDRDAATYFECLWEVPILELLVNLHAKAGDEERVNTLIGLLQQPALNVHNPPAIRQAHICTMEQRFLQRLAGELLD